MVPKVIVMVAWKKVWMDDIRESIPQGQDSPVEPNYE
jgi:hypothetical protein